MDFLEIPVADLIPYENNPRHNEKAIDAVAESIKEFGFKVPVVIDKSNVIVCGHTRHQAALKLGLEKVPAIRADDLTDEQVKAFRIADNKTNELAEWDSDKLIKELMSIDKIDMSKFNFDLSAIGYEMQPDEISEGPEPESPPAEPITKLGDMYALGNHVLLCGDSTDIEQVKKLTGGAMIDLLLTDPPYNVDYEGKEERLLKVRPNKRVSENIKTGIKNDKLSDEKFYYFLLDIYKTAAEVMRPGAAFYIWHADSNGLIFRQALKDAGLELRQNLIWVKNHFVLGRQDYQWIHEPCLYGWKNGAAHYFINDYSQKTVTEETEKQDFKKMKKEELIQLLEKLTSEAETPTTIIHEDKPVRSSDHPTMKPVKLFARQIINSSKKGQNVLDLFGGSGTTLLACEQLGRRAFLMEYEPKYCDVIINRWEQFTGRKAEKIN